MFTGRISLLSCLCHVDVTRRRRTEVSWLRPAQWLRAPDSGPCSLLLQRLQQEVSGLREEFRKQEARWAATHRELRAQVDALVKQNLELRAGLRASERRRLEAKRSAAGSVHVRRHSEARVPGPLFASPEHHPQSRVLGAG